MNAYQHTVQYYETDRMGITHHSNYIRWMEEARVDFLQQLVCTGHSEHCFLNREGTILRLHREYPAFYTLLQEQMAEDETRRD